MTALRPTTLRLFTECCPAALQFYEDGAPTDRSIFAVGTAAHEVLCAYGSGQDVDGIIHKMLTVGRTGIDAEPPLSPDAVFAGRDIALRYIEQRGLPDRSVANFEVGFAFDAGWNPVDYHDESARFRVRPDVVEVVTLDTEDTYGVGLCTRDYKTAWPTSAAILDSIQFKAQAVAVWSENPKRFGLDAPPDFIRREAVNLRTLETFSDEVWLADSPDVLPAWRADLDALIAAASGPRTASPGAHCIGCPYVRICPAAIADAASAAVSYAAAVARVKALEPLARAAAGEGRVPVPGGSVGWQTKATREAADDAALTLWSMWAPGNDDPFVRGFLTALDIGVTQVRAAARALFPDRKQKADRDALAESMLSTKLQRRFGVELDAPQDEEEEG